nr:MAG TPA: hypothetical protein [Bacteriophage sp.]DAN08250.1 MAG TPA: hypothetical protein [Caudoviricetes sp.]
MNLKFKYCKEAVLMWAEMKWDFKTISAKLLMF